MWTAWANLEKNILFYFYFYFYTFIYPCFFLFFLVWYVWRGKTWKMCMKNVKSSIYMWNCVYGVRLVICLYHWPFLMVKMNLDTYWLCCKGKCQLSLFRISVQVIVFVHYLIIDNNQPLQRICAIQLYYIFFFHFWNCTVI